MRKCLNVGITGLARRGRQDAFQRFADQIATIHILPLRRSIQQLFQGCCPPKTQHFRFRLLRRVCVQVFGSSYVGITSPSTGKGHRV